MSEDRAIFYNEVDSTYKCYFFDERGNLTGILAGHYEDVDGVTYYYDDDNGVYIDLENKYAGNGIPE